MKNFIVVFLALSPAAAFADVRDKVIYDALNVQEIALPTHYPFAGFAKYAGRLSCSHTKNTQTLEESYLCLLQE